MTDAWLRRFAPVSEPIARLVCLSHAGGSASVFYSLARMLAPRIEVLAVQYPGRQDRRAEPLIDDLESLATPIAAALGGARDRPLAFFGHSLGATVALDVAARLEQDGTLPIGLVASAARPPGRRGATPLHTLNDADLLAELRTLGGVVPTDPELVAMTLPAVRADYRALAGYAGRATTLSCPITAMLGTDDARVDAADAYAWAGHTTGAFHCRFFPGGHFYLTAHTAELSRTLTDLVLAWCRSTSHR